MDIEDNDNDINTMSHFSFLRCFGSFHYAELGITAYPCPMAVPDEDILYCRSIALLVFF